MAKLVTDTLLKKSVEDVLTELVNSTFDWQEYTDEEIGQIIELDPTQVAELSAVINDSVAATNKVYSSQHTKELIQESLIEANKYSDDLVANLSNIKLDIVDSLPDSSTVNKSTIYILKDSTGGTNNTLNVWSDTTSAFVEVGKLSVNMDNYYTKSEVDAELTKKANADEVLKPDAIVADLTTTSGSTTLSTAGLQTELDKKANDDEVLKTTDIATTIDSTSTDTKVASAKVVYDKAIKDKKLKTYTALSQLGLTTPITVGEIFNAIPDGSLVVIQCADVKNYITDVPNSYGLLTIEKIEKGRFSILFKQSLSGSVAVNNFYIGQLQGSDGSGLTWSRVCTTKAIDVNTPIIKNPTFPSNIVLGEGGASIKYVVKNGWVNLYIGFNIKSCDRTFTWTSLLSGLPLPANSANITLMPEGGKAKEPIAIRIISNGTLEYKIGTVITTEDWWTGNIIYPVAEVTEVANPTT